jgi:hypothetical protein
MSQNNNYILNGRISRVQGSCSLVTESPIAFDRNRFSTVPYTGKIVSTTELPYEIAMLRKGNILQYKKNSSNLTKKQQYSQLAQGKWYYRKTWATQSSRGYTNPNTNNLQRVNSETVELFPNSDNPVYIQDFGTLVCGTLENPVTGVVITQPPKPNCHPTTDSDVPGRITELCWNDGITPWFPRTRYNMSNSNSKLYTNYKLTGGLQFFGLTLRATVICLDSTVKLDWVYNNKCIPALGYNIYQNGTLLASVPSTPTTYTFTPLEGNQIYYVTAINRNAESQPSNVVIINPSIGFVINDTNLDNIIVTPTSLTILANLTIDVNCVYGGKTINIVCVGGGGGGGGGTFGNDDGGGGGGGGGGNIQQVFNFAPVATTYSVNIGTGGQGGDGGYFISPDIIMPGTNGSDGGSTTLIGGATNITANGGQGGKGNGQTNSNSGGNGGISTGTPGTIGGLGGTGSTVDVNGKNGDVGGGGGGGSGYNSSFGTGGNGAINIPVINYGTEYGAGGGGGGANNTGGIGGNENAGNGGDDTFLKGYDGIPNTGGGGGGGQGSNGSVERDGGGGGNGGSGVVIIYV